MPRELRLDGDGVSRKEVLFPDRCSRLEDGFSPSGSLPLRAGDSESIVGNSE
jgi:hypothetical protein